MRLIEDNPEWSIFTRRIGYGNLKTVDFQQYSDFGYSIYGRQQQAALLFCISNPLFCLILSYIPSLFQTPDKYEVARCVGFSISYKIAYSLIRIQGICPLHKQTVLIYQVLHMRFVQCTMHYHNHLGSNKLYF